METLSKVTRGTSCPRKRESTVKSRGALPRDFDPTLTGPLERLKKPLGFVILSNWRYHREAFSCHDHVIPVKVGIQFVQVTWELACGGLAKDLFSHGSIRYNRPFEPDSDL